MRALAIQRDHQHMRGLLVCGRHALAVAPLIQAKGADTFGQVNDQLWLAAWDDILCGG